MSISSKSNIIIVLFRRYPSRSLIILTVMFFAGLLESVGLLSILPLLELAMQGAVTEGSQISFYFKECLSFFSIDITIGNILIIIVFLLVVKSALSLVAMNYIGSVIAKMAAELRMEIIRAVLGTRWQFFWIIQLDTL